MKAIIAILTFLLLATTLWGLSEWDRRSALERRLQQQERSERFQRLCRELGS
jgi:hypothetical protein